MPVSTTDLSGTIFETLKSELLDLTIKPGEEIKEAALCERFSVTRPPVRTALRRLSDMNLVEIKPYYGIHATLLDMDKVYQIITMRIIVETQIVLDFVDSKPNGFILEELEHNIRLQKLLVKQGNVNRNQFFELDNALHSTWFKERHCSVVWNIIQEQKIEYTRFRMLDYKALMKYSEMVSDHEELVKAIVSRDKKRLPFIIGSHLNNGLKRIESHILNDYKDFVIPPKDGEFWRDYNKRYYKEV